MEWEMADLDPKRVIEDSLAAASGLFQEDRVELDVQIPDALPAVHADRDRLMQVIVNLLSNAAKFCDQRHGRVVVEARAGAQGVQASVADNAPGLRPEAVRLIVDKFQQSGALVPRRPRRPRRRTPHLRRHVALTEVHGLHAALRGQGQIEVLLGDMTGLDEDGADRPAPLLLDIQRLVNLATTELSHLDENTA